MLCFLYKVKSFQATVVILNVRDWPGWQSLL